jgi:hypothetical protein
MWTLTDAPILAFESTFRYRRHREPMKTNGERYKFFSRGSHPNRNMVPHRHLGNGNQFVLGAIGLPDLIVFSDHCLQHLSLWFWFAAVSTFRYRELTGEEYGDKYLKTAARAKEVAAALLNETKRLRSQGSRNTEHTT